jgi:4-aminobutyrate aminotransferase
MSANLLSPVWTHLTTIQPVKGEGIYLYDAGGRRYTDFTCGIGVTNTGHCHPKVVKAIQDQAASLIFGQMNIVVPPTTVGLPPSTAISSPIAGRRPSRPALSLHATLPANAT